MACYLLKAQICVSTFTKNELDMENIAQIYFAPMSKSNYCGNFTEMNLFPRRMLLIKMLV